VLNSTAIASGYVSRDPQGETSDGRFLVLFSQLEMVKDLLLVLEKKKKNKLQLS